MVVFFKGIFALKKLILAVVSILFLVIIGLLVGPSFIDWNKYKEQIITQAEKATGYNIAINGDLSLSILPAPKLKIEGLVVEAPKKVKFENLLQMKSAEVSVQLMPLLSKNIAVDKVTLIEPIIDVEMFKEGGGSWVTKKMEAASAVKKLAGEQGDKAVKQIASGALDSIALNSVKIEKGVLSFYDHKKDAAHQVNNLNVALKAKTLKGPFDVKGDLNYNEKDIAVDMAIGAYDPTSDNISLNGAVSLPKEGASVNYNGLVAVKAPFDAQGQVKLAVNDLSKLVSNVPDALKDKISLEGLVTANENKVVLNDLIAFVGDARATGQFSADNFKQKNPVNINADLTFNQAIDLGSFSSDKNASKTSAQSGDKTKQLIPSSLTLPMAIDADVKINTPGLKFDGKAFNGVALAINKKAGKMTVSGRVNEFVGQGAIEGNINASYGARSVSPKSGAVTYTDPSVAFDVDGRIGEIAKTLNAFAPDIDKKTASMFKTAQFDLKGSISPKSLRLNDSALKLDQTSIGLAGSYAPASIGRGKASIDVSLGDINADQLLGKSGASAGGQGASSPAQSGGLKEALKPLQEFSLPVDLTFDVSVQKARVNGADIAGIRLKGASIGNKLTLENAGVNDYQGAALSAKGVISNRSDLSGLDLNLGLKTSDVQGFARAMKIDASKLPTSLKAVDASATLKGAINALNMNANIAAMSGQLDVSGAVKEALGTPQLNNMRIGLKHPNLANAIKIVAPDFKGNAGLSQAVNFSANAASNGNVITLSDMKTTLGKTSFSGDLKITQGKSSNAISGNIQAGTIALDDLLGAKSAGGSSGGSKSSSERWSKDAINVDWMNTTNVDLSLAANAIQYGAWNFVKPSTNVKVSNGALTVSGLKAGVFGGNATLNLAVKAPSQSGGALSLNADSAMNGISLEALAGALSKSKKLQSAGDVSFSFDVSSNGASAHALINALSGKAALDGKDVVLKGFDLNKMARGLAVDDKLASSFASLAQGSLQGGETRFDTIKGDYGIAKGVVNINSMAMTSDASEIVSSGYASLPEWNINTDHTITLKNVPDLAPFTVKIKGPLDNPANTFGKNVIEDYLTDKLKRKLTKELGNKLPDVLGNDVTDKLQQFGILPQATKKAAPADAAPASDGVANDNALPEAAQPVAPVEEKKKIKKPEDALKEILNSDSPEDAVGNVLKGLF